MCNTYLFRKKCSNIYANPPWSYSDENCSGAAEAQYCCMKVCALRKSVPIHNENRREIQYLWDYYRGKQPILNRKKEIRPEICNKIVENRANEIVYFNVGYLCGEPVQYVGRKGDEAPFEMYTLDPRNSFVVYSTKIGNKPLMGVKYYKDGDGLPVNVIQIVGNNGIMLLKNSQAHELRRVKAGISVFSCKQWFIIYDETLPLGRKRFTIAH